MSKGKLLAICVVWLFVAGAAAMAWRFFVVGGQERAEELRNEDVLRNTTGQSQYDHDVKFGIDPFSGYAILRSDDFKAQLRQRKIDMTLVDDGADYNQRLQDLQNGTLNMGVFTIDALLKASDRLGDLPAVIVCILDETRGADAIVANKTGVPNVLAMNNTETRFVLIPDSPSETLARVVMNDFNLNKLPTDPFIPVNDPEAILARYAKSKSDSREVYVTWEPFVSKLLEKPEMHVVVDSSSFRGRIVDVIVSSRDFLAKNPQVVEAVVASYFTAAYAYRDQMETLVRTDAEQQNAPLTEEQAATLTAGIRWKNTQENFAHFGLREDGDLQHIEDMIDNLARVLSQTGGIQSDPTGGRSNRLFYEQILAKLKGSNFHPGLSAEQIASDKIELPSLSDEEWGALRPVGELSVPNLVFARGTTRLTNASYAVLDELVNTLNTWPQYYLLVRGNASMRGDLEANKRVAENRAQAAAEYLIQQGVSKNRLHAIGSDPSGSTSVSFVLGEAPF